MWCVCVCVCVCLYVCVCMFVCVYVCVCMYASVYASVNLICQLHYYRWSLTHMIAAREHGDILHIVGIAASVSEVMSLTHFASTNTASQGSAERESGKPL